MQLTSSAVMEWASSWFMESRENLNLDKKLPQVISALHCLPLSWTRQSSSNIAWHSHLTWYIMMLIPQENLCLCLQLLVMLQHVNPQVDDIGKSQLSPKSRWGPDAILLINWLHQSRVGLDWSGHPSREFCAAHLISGNILIDAMFWNLDEESALASGTEYSPACAPHSPSLVLGDAGISPDLLGRSECGK